MFLGLHALLAQRTQTPELELTEEEAKGFMTAVQNVARHYSVQTTQKGLDIAAMFGIVGTMYGPRIMAIRFRKAREDAERNAGPVSLGAVHTFPGAGNR